MKLPQPSQAVVDIRKLRDYCLNPRHPRGRHKARVFAAALGFTEQDAPRLQQKLLEVTHSHEATRTYEDVYGILYRIDFEMEGKMGNARIRSTWIVRRGEAFPRFVTCYVL